VSIGHGLDSLRDDWLNDGSAGNDSGNGDRVVDNSWGSLDHGFGHRGGWGGNVVWVVVVVHVWVVVVVVERVVGVVEGAVGVGVVVTVVEESFCLGISVSLGGGLALGQSMSTEGQGSATSRSDTVVWSVWADLTDNSWGGDWSGSDDWG